MVRKHKGRSNGALAGPERSPAPCPFKFRTPARLRLPLGACPGGISRGRTEWRCRQGGGVCFREMGASAGWRGRVRRTGRPRGWHRRPFPDSSRGPLGRCRTRAHRASRRERPSSPSVAVRSQTAYRPSPMSTRSIPTICASWPASRHSARPRPRVQPITRSTPSWRSNAIGSGSPSVSRARATAAVASGEGFVDAGVGLPGVRAGGEDVGGVPGREEGGGVTELR